MILIDFFFVLISHGARMLANYKYTNRDSELQNFYIHDLVSVLMIYGLFASKLFGPLQANLVLIAYASSEGSGEPAHPRSLARTIAARSYKQWVKRNLQTESQIPGPSEWLGMRSYNLSWRNARRHKFAWRGSFYSFNRGLFRILLRMWC